MTKQKFLSIAVILLVLTNLAVLVFFISTKPQPPAGQKIGEGPKNIIIERLHFSKDQIDEYEAIIAIHRFEIEEQERKMRDLKHQLYESLVENESERDALISQISATQAKVENIHYAHFLELKKLCKPDQINDFNELTKDLARLFAPLPPMHHKPMPN